MFTTMVRFDTAYATIMNCNWKQIRYDYPNLHRWLRQLYWEADKEAKGAFKCTTHFEIVSYRPHNPEEKQPSNSVTIEEMYMKLTCVIVDGGVCKVCNETEACTVGSSCPDPASQCKRASKQIVKY